MITRAERFYRDRPLIVDAVVGSILALIAYRTTIFTPGVIAMRFEWYVPTYPRDLMNSAAWASHAWHPANFGIAAVYPTYIFSVWWHWIVASVGLNAYVIDRLEVFVPFVVAFAGMSAFCRAVTRSTAAGLMGGTLFATSPFLFYHTAAGHLPYTQSYALIPWALFFAMRLGRDRLRAAFPLALIGALTPQPQAILFGAILVAVVAYVYGGVVKGTVAFAVIVGGFVLANAFWIVPVLLYAHSTVQTLEHLQPVNIEFYLAHSIAARSVVSVLLLRDYDNTINLQMPPAWQALSWPLKVLALSVPAWALYAVIGRPPPLRKLTLIFAGTSVLFAALLLGPAGILEKPIVYLYERFAAMSLFKENYHFAYPLSVTLIVLAVMGARTAARTYDRRAVFALVAMGICGWAAPTLASGNLGGWGQPEIPDPSWAAPAVSQDIAPDRVMILPGTANLHPAERVGGGDGIDPNLFSDRSFGSWISLNPMGVSLLHRVHDDRLEELPQLMSLAGIRYAYVRDDIRASLWQDNPYWDLAVLRRDGFTSGKLVGEGVDDVARGDQMHLGTYLSPSVSVGKYETTNRIRPAGWPAHWDFAASGIVRMRLPIHANRVFRAQYRISRSLGIVVNANFTSGNATLHAFVTSSSKVVFDYWKPANERWNRQSVVLPVLKAGSRLVVEIYPVEMPFAGLAAVREAALHPVLISRRFRASANEPLIIPVFYAKRADCAVSRFSTNYIPSALAGALAMEYVTDGALEACPPKGELLASRVPTSGAAVSPGVVVYDGDLTGVRAVTGPGSATPSPPLVRIDTWWSLPLGSRPRVFAIAAGRGGEALGSLLDCSSLCKLYQPADNGSAFDNYDLHSGWVMGNLGSDWESYYVDLDTESTFRFVATKTTQPFYWNVPCNSSDGIMIAVSTNRPITVAYGPRSRTIPARRTADTRVFQRWYNLGPAICSGTMLRLKIRPRGAGVTALDAIVAYPLRNIATRSKMQLYSVTYGSPIHPFVSEQPADLTGATASADAPPSVPQPVLTMRIGNPTSNWPAPRSVGMKQINPSAYIVSWESLGTTGGAAAVFTLPENFDPQWRLYVMNGRPNGSFWWFCVVTATCEQADSVHLQVNGFANGWIVRRAVRSGDLLAVYVPEAWYAAVKTGIDVLIALVALLLCMISVLRMAGKVRSDRDAVGS